MSIHEKRFTASSTGSSSDDDDDDLYDNDPHPRPVSHLENLNTASNIGAPAAAAVAASEWHHRDCEPKKAKTAAKVQQSCVPSPNRKSTTQSSSPKTTRKRTNEELTSMALGRKSQRPRRRRRRRLGIQCLSQSMREEWHKAEQQRRFSEHLKLQQQQQQQQQQQRRRRVGTQCRSQTQRRAAATASQKERPRVARNHPKPNRDFSDTDDDDDDDDDDSQPIHRTQPDRSQHRHDPPLGNANGATSAQHTQKSWTTGGRSSESAVGTNNDDDNNNNNNLPKPLSQPKRQSKRTGSHESRPMEQDSDYYHNNDSTRAVAQGSSDGRGTSSPNRLDTPKKDDDKEPEFEFRDGGDAVEDDENNEDNNNNPWSVSWAPQPTQQRPNHNKFGGRNNNKSPPVIQFHIPNNQYWFLMEGVKVMTGVDAAHYLTDLEQHHKLPAISETWPTRGRCLELLRQPIAPGTWTAAVTTTTGTWSQLQPQHGRMRLVHTDYATWHDNDDEESGQPWLRHRVDPTVSRTHHLRRRGMLPVEKDDDDDVACFIGSLALVACGSCTSNHDSDLWEDELCAACASQTRQGWPRTTNGVVCWPPFAALSSRRRPKAPTPAASAGLAFPVCVGLSERAYDVVLMTDPVTHSVVAVELDFTAPQRTARESLGSSITTAHSAAATTMAILEWPMMMQQQQQLPQSDREHGTEPSAVPVISKRKHGASSSFDESPCTEQCTPVSKKSKCAMASAFQDNNNYNNNKQDTGGPSACSMSSSPSLSCRDLLLTDWNHAADSVDAKVASPSSSSPSSSSSRGKPKAVTKTNAVVSAATMIVTDTSASRQIVSMHTAISSKRTPAYDQPVATVTRPVVGPPIPRVTASPHAPFYATAPSTAKRQLSRPLFSGRSMKDGVRRREDLGASARPAWYPEAEAITRVYEQNDAHATDDPSKADSDVLCHDIVGAPQSDFLLDDADSLCQNNVADSDDKNACRCADSSPRLALYAALFGGDDEVYEETNQQQHAVMEVAADWDDLNEPFFHNALLGQLSASSTQDDDNNSSSGCWLWSILWLALWTPWLYHLWQRLLLQYGSSGVEPPWAIDETQGGTSSWSAAFPDAIVAPLFEADQGYVGNINIV